MDKPIMQRIQQQRGFGVVEIMIVLAVVALLGVGGWYVWQAQQNKNQNQTNNTSNSSQSTPKPDTDFKVTELGVEFEAKDAITPLYFVQDWSLNGVSYKLARFSTQQLVDKGVSQGSANPCQFHTDKFSDADHSLLNLAAYNSQADVLKANSGNPQVTADKIKPENGYFTINGKIFAVPQSVQSGSGACLDDATFESQQWASLQHSLMTLRAIQ